ncbi:MAG: phosphatidylserine decarboxylase [Beijerinckiaceae bacterium]
MSMFQSIRKQVVPIHPEGYIFIAAFAVAALLLGWLWNPLGWIGAILTCWCAYFFRDPPRVTPLRAELIVSPADGYVSSVGLYSPPPELGLGSEPRQRVSVFMSVFDCHVNRSPVAGLIRRIAYKPGLFVNADLDKASDDNERNSLLIDAPGGTFGIVQIAGLLARRIVPFVHEGDTVAAGERIGLIRFGSRVDVYMPDGVSVLVGLGTKAIAGETILAELGTNPAPLAFKVA